MILVVIWAGHSGARDPAQVHYHHSGDPQVIAWPCTSSAYDVWHMAVLRTCHTARALETGSVDSTVTVRTWYLTCHAWVTVYICLIVVVSVTERVGGNSLFVALISGY